MWLRHRASPRSSSSESSDESEDQLRITPARRPQQLSRKQQKKQAWFEKQQLQNQQLQHGKKSKKSKAKQRARQGSVSEMDESEDDRGTKPLYPRLDPTGAGLEKFQERNSARAERFGNGALAAKRAVAPKVPTQTAAISLYSLLHHQQSRSCCPGTEAAPRAERVQDRPDKFA